MQAEGENSSSSRVSKATKLFAVALVGSALLVASVLQLEEVRSFDGTKLPASFNKL
jgi:hypothetical protein